MTPDPSHVRSLSPSPTPTLTRRPQRVRPRSRRDPTRPVDMPTYAAPRRPPTSWTGAPRLVEDGPATWGWRGRASRWSGGLVQPRRGRAEQAYERARATVQQEFDGPRTIAFVNPKGGAAKTTSVLATGYTFGTVRGGGVIAWDNNETRGTLGIRAARGSHHNTTRELIADLERFTDAQSRIGDLDAFVRHQGDAHFDVLASDERPDVTGTIRGQDYTDVHRLLQRFYRLVLVDTGNNMRAENWLAAADAADLLVVTSTVREDTGYSGLWMLDALADAGYPNLKYKTITVLSDPSHRVDEGLARDLVEVYSQRTRNVHRVPFDPALVTGVRRPLRAAVGGQPLWLRRALMARPDRGHAGAVAAGARLASGAMTALSGSRVRHCVAFTLRHDEGTAEEAAFLDALRALGAIPGVEAFEVVAEVSPKNDYRYGVSMEFADRAAYAAYDAHPDHVAFVRDRWVPDVADFLEIDFAAS